MVPLIGFPIHVIQIFWWIYLKFERNTRDSAGFSSVISLDSSWKEDWKDIQLIHVRGGNRTKKNYSNFWMKIGFGSITDTFKRFLCTVRWKWSKIKNFALIKCVCSSCRSDQQGFGRHTDICFIKHLLKISEMQPKTIFVHNFQNRVVCLPSSIQVS